VPPSRFRPAFSSKLPSYWGERKANTAAFYDKAGFDLRPDMGT
jgi:hypothetical protein